MTVDDDFLELLSKEGGKAHLHRIANLRNIGFDYARSVLNSLGRRDFIDFFRDEVAVLTDKGKERLEKEKQKQFVPTASEQEKAAMDRRMKPYREKDEQ
jgi:predicted transcriptional regulator